MSELWFAFSLTLLAGLSTGLGAVIALLTKPTNRSFLAASLGLSGGVMIYVSLVEILPLGQEAIASEHDPKAAAWMSAAAFFGGIAIAAIIDRLVPEGVNPHEPRLNRSEMHGVDPHLLRVGLVTALAVGLHNFPEGFATFMTALKEPSLALPVAVAIAIHNIPEGIAVAVPIHHATKSKWRAFVIALGSGLAEPIGALIGYLLLRPFLSQTMLGAVLASVAGIMIFISLDELLPTAEKYGKHHVAIYGVIAGMALMAISLIMLS